MRIHVRHELSFTPPPGSAHAVQQLLLTPRSGPTQTVAGWTIDMPGMAEASTFFDAFANTCHLVSQTRPEGGIAVSVSGIVDTFDRNGVLGRIDSEPVPTLFRRRTKLTPPDEELAEALRRFDAKSKRIALLHELMARVNALAEGEPEDDQSQSQSQAENGDQSQSQSQSGPAPLTREDLAHRFIGTARALDIPARFVTGYLARDDDDEVAGLHAWVEAFDEGLGWIGFDPALGYCPTDMHVRLATGLDATSTAPIRCSPLQEPPRLVALSVLREE